MAGSEPRPGAGPEGLRSVAASGSAADWRAAIRSAVELLVAEGLASPEYTEDCVSAVEAHGPYIVLSRGLALAHARPDASRCFGVGLSLYRLGDAVAFGHAANDPVDLVFALVTTDDRAHVQALKKFAAALGRGLADRLRTVADEDLADELAAAFSR